MSITVAEICRFPVKGLSAERLEEVTLTANKGLPADRAFALAHGAVELGAGWHSKANFLTLEKHEKLAQLRVRYDAEAQVLAIDRGGKQVVQGQVGTPMGRMLIGQFFASFMAGETRGTPKLLAAKDFSYSDRQEELVSLINLASVSDLERVVRAPVAPGRFRGNLYLEGVEAWQEMAWAGKTLTLGEARLEVLEPIGRCAATNVDPETAARDLNLPLTLTRGFGHRQMGVYARVAQGGRIATGNEITLNS
ncbi:MAG: MOSC domain-containing protein [Pseudomonadota bacterium]